MLGGHSAARVAQEQLQGADARGQSRRPVWGTVRTCEGGWAGLEQARAARWRPLAVIRHRTCWDAAAVLR